MTPDLLLALAGFAFVTSITPGPSNMLLLASGVNHGFVRSVPLAFGINFGFLSMLVAVGLGLGQLLNSYPAAYQLMRIISIGYVIWLAWKIAGSTPSAPAPDNPETAAPQPINFIQGALLQWVNPKAWIVAMIVTVNYTVATDYVINLTLMIAIFGLINLPSISTWALSGMFLKRILNNPAKLRIINIVFALLLVASILPVALDIPIGSP